MYVCIYIGVYIYISNRKSVVETGRIDRLVSFRGGEGEKGGENYNSWDGFIFILFYFVVIIPASTLLLTRYLLYSLRTYDGCPCTCPYRDFLGSLCCWGGVCWYDDDDEVV